MGRSQVDQAPDFADVLNASIERWYESRGDFARKAKIAEASVSRWINRISRPTPDRIKHIAPHVFDAKGKPFPGGWLEGLVYPNLARGATRTVYLDRPISTDMHPLAEEVNQLLTEGVMPAAERERLEALQDALLVPYRRYRRNLRGRKIG